MHLTGFAVNVLVISLILAIFEISIEKDKGWATGLGPFWGKQYGGLIATIAEKHYLTRYHIVMFCGVLPLILVTEYLRVRTGILLFVASWLAIGVLEDFLWFVLNWYFPGSLRMLLAGKIWWHPKYWAIGSIQLPRYYFVSSIYIAALCCAQYYLKGPLR